MTNNGAATYNVSGTGLTLNNTVYGAATPALVTKTGFGTLTVGGSSDNINLRLQVNDGTVVLNKASSANVHAVGSGGGTDYAVINNGTVQLAGSGNDQIYTKSAVNVAFGTLDLNGTNGEGFDGLVGQRNTVTNMGTAASTLRLARIIVSAPLNLRASSATATIPSLTREDGHRQRQIISGANTYSGTTTIDDGGTLQVGNGGTTGTLGTGDTSNNIPAGNVINNGTLTFKHSDDPSIPTWFDRHQPDQRDRVFGALGHGED